MSERLWPVDAVGGAPRYSGRGLRQLHGPYLGGASAADPLGAWSGVRPGTPTTTVTATSTTWRCGLHAGVLDVQPAVEAGPYTYAIDEPVTGNMNAADASNPRTDRIYVQLTDQAEGNASKDTPPSVRVLYVAGVARADAPVPALPARAMKLARINVPKQGGGNPTVTFEAPLAVAAGAARPFATKAEMDDAPGYAGARALVYADPTGRLNGDYAWSGKWIPASREVYRVLEAPTLRGNVAQAPPPGDAVFVRHIKPFYGRTDASGLLQVGYDETFAGILTVNPSAWVGTATQPAINSGQVSKTDVVLAFADNKGGIVSGTIEVVGWQ